ncbi:unnamed protein product, partial [Effrenium voratum]
MRGVPFLPRFDDALVAEFAESDAFSLEGRDRRFGGTHLGFDRGDLYFTRDMDNFTEWLADRALKWPE